MNNIRQQIRAKIRELQTKPVAFGALWDGDTRGWYIYFAAVMATEHGYQGSSLGSIDGGGDIRVFHGQVPPWVRQ